MEVCNSRISHLVRLRSETAIYVHTQIVEGHTERGQLLAAPAAFGGGGYSIEFSRRRALGGWTAAVRSDAIAQNGEGGTWNGAHVGFHSVEVARVWSAKRAEYTVGANTQIGWNALARGNNVGVFLTIRPTAMFPVPRVGK